MIYMILGIPISIFSYIIENRKISKSRWAFYLRSLFLIKGAIILQWLESGQYDWAVNMKTHVKIENRFKTHMGILVFARKYAYYDTQWKYTVEFWRVWILMFILSTERMKMLNVCRYNYWYQFPVWIYVKHQSIIL